MRSNPSRRLFQGSGNIRLLAQNDDGNFVHSRVFLPIVVLVPGLNLNVRWIITQWIIINAVLAKGFGAYMTFVNLSEIFDEKRRNFSSPKSGSTQSGESQRLAQKERLQVLRGGMVA